MFHKIHVFLYGQKNQPDRFFLAIMPLDLHCKQLTTHILPPYSFQYIMPSHTNLHYVHKLLTIDSQIHRHTSSYCTLRIHTVGQVQKYSRKQYHLACKLHHTNNHLKEDQSRPLVALNPPNLMNVQLKFKYIDAASQNM